MPLRGDPEPYYSRKIKLVKMKGHGMQKQASARKPRRNRHGAIIYTSLQQRPQPNFKLTPLYRGLQLFSAVVAIALPVVFLIVASGREAVLPLQYGPEGQINRSGSLTEATVTLVVVGLSTLGSLVLARYPRIMNYPVMLTEYNVQQQYQYGVKMVLWVAASCAAIMVVMVVNWTTALSIGWMWLPFSLMFATMGFYIWRMFTTP